MVLSLFFSLVFVLLLLAALITVQHIDLAAPSTDLARGLQDSANKTHGRGTEHCVCVILHILFSYRICGNLGNVWKHKRLMWSPCLVFAAHSASLDTVGGRWMAGGTFCCQWHEIWKGIIG